jgi:phage FluMu protein Com
MPIRFRCAYCNQLMGIARRKAGTVVRCPKCAGQVVVPQPESYEEHVPGNSHHAAANPPAQAPGGQAPPGEIKAGAGLFEQGDFSKAFDHGPAAGPEMRHPPSFPNPSAGNPRPVAANPVGPQYEAVPLGPVKGRPRGVFLTSGVLSVVSALVVILMGMAFFLGVLLGRSAAPPP